MSATAQTKDDRHTPTRDQGRVLRITDDLSVVSYSDVLDGECLSVVGVAAGAAALVVLQRTRPHVVIADAKVKGISANELARMFANSQEYIPLVLVGEERANAGRRMHALASGAFDYFQMPSESVLLLARIAQLIAIKQTMDQLRAEADRDYLTGLGNRRRFSSALRKDVERWRRYDVPCALLLLDIDHLKKINDAHGHPAGDRVIRTVAGALMDLSRNTDTAARLGGEEFALLLAGVDTIKAVAAAERLRKVVEGDMIEGIGKITVSLGVAACPAHAQTERALFTASDAALYQAKREGRNRTVVATASLAV